MEKKKQWILGREAVLKFEKYREERYLACGIKQFDHNLFTNYYLHLLIHFMRKRKNHKDNIFANQQLLHTAVSLFKRFYLVNEHRRGEEPSQLVWISVYLSLKLNQMPETEIKAGADIWKSKKTVNNLFNEHFKHFCDPGYSEIEREFLKGFGFQLGISQLIPSLESLYKTCEQRKSNLNFASILSCITKSLSKIYYDSEMMFSYAGPKLALGIMIASIIRLLEDECPGLDDSKIDAKIFSDYFGEEIGEVIVRNWKQISEIYIKLKTTTIQSLKDKSAQVKISEMRKLFRTHKKTFQKPKSKSNQSPRMSPERNLDIPPLNINRMEE